MADNTYNWFQQWIADNAVKGKEADINQLGEYNAATWDKVAGFFTGVDVDKAVDANTDMFNDQASEKIFSKSTLTDPELKKLGFDPTKSYTPTEAETLVNKGLRLRQLDDRGEASTTRIREAMAPVNATLKSQGQQLTNQIERERLKFNYMEQRDANIRAETKAERLMDKAEARRERLDLLDRQDHRYSQEMQRYDKRRQKETIQSLVAGLASLGAAFAM